MKLLKFSSDTCSVCKHMVPIETSVTTQLGVDFLEVKMQNAALYRQYRHILLNVFPDKKDMGWPTYVLIDDDEEISGTIIGGKPKPEFLQAVQEIIPAKEEQQE